jgi:hypothetical protein
MQLHMVKCLVFLSCPAGDVVVYEQPLLHVPQLKPSNPLYQPLQVCVVLQQL